MSQSDPITVINRDPRRMMQYGHDAKVIVEEMIFNLRKIEGLLDACRSRLDDNANKRIDELHECCSTFRREIVAYREIAETIEKKGKSLLYAREQGG